jgi:Bacterial Ig-like domain (group 1)
MKVLNWFAASFLLAFLAACGGGGGSSGSTGAGGGGGGGVVLPPSATPSSIELLADSASLPSGNGSIQITAVVKNANNAGMPSQTVTFSTTSGNLSIADNGITKDTGVAAAALTVGADKSLRNITLTAVAGAARATLVIPVVGTKVKVNGDLSMQAGAVVQYSVKLTDSSGTAIANRPVSLTSRLGNAISNSGTANTDFNGVFTFAYTANNAGIDTLTASGLGAVDSIALNISNIDYQLLSPSANTNVPVNTLQAISVRYRVGGAGQTGQNVTFSTTRGVLSSSSATTDGSGVATVSISSASSGLASVVANITGVGQVTLPLQFIATTPASIALQANPGALPPNSSGGDASQAAIEAIVRDVSGNAVANRLVDFNLALDTSGGRLSQPSATTDLNGRASVQFISGANSTASNGVVIGASVRGSSPLVSNTTRLTVNGESLFISIAFGNTLGNENETTYKKQFSIYVTDANGIAVTNKNITLRVIPTVYGKGFLTYSAGQPEFQGQPAIPGGWVYGSYVSCLNEDLNLNGQIDPGEDINNDGRLQPGLPVFTRPGSVTTDSTGLVSFDLLYGEQYASWLTVRLEARATVGGTESVSSIQYFLSALASDLSATTTPANVVSPFGRATSCTNPN